MVGEAIRVIFIPFLGTALGAAGVLFMKKDFNAFLHLALRSCWRWTWCWDEAGMAHGGEKVPYPLLIAIVFGLVTLLPCVKM